MSTKRKITKRYTLALFLVATALIGSHLLMSRQAADNITEGRLINISGMQRMLSQRIALIANEISYESEEAIREKLAVKLQTSCEKMVANRVELNEDYRSKASKEFESLYFSADGIDESVGEYLLLAEELLKVYRLDPSAKAELRQISNKIAKIARDGFLDQLDSVVTRYEVRLQNKLGFLQWIEFIVLCVGLGILVVEALFIFRPMANEIENAFNKLTSRNQELTEFSYRISHDLRAPIASSLGMTRVIRESLEEREIEDASDAVDRVEKSLERLDCLITDVIEVTKNKNVEPEKITIPLLELVDDILERNSHLDGFDRVRIEKKINAGDSVFAEHIFLTQSLENLITNAIKYSDLNEPEPHLIIDASLDSDYCTIQIMDNGIGVPTDSQHELFGMFKRFHPRQSFGSGLGLYLVMQNVKRLGGAVSFEPLAKGSNFKIQFPLSSEVALS